MEVSISRPNHSWAAEKSCHRWAYDIRYM